MSQGANSITARSPKTNQIGPLSRSYIIVYKCLAWNHSLGLTHTCWLEFSAHLLEMDLFRNKLIGTKGKLDGWDAAGSFDWDREHRQRNQLNQCLFLHSFVCFLMDEMCRRMEMISYSFEVMKALLQPFELQFFPEQMAKRWTCPTFWTVTPDRGWAVCRSQGVVKLAGTRSKEKNNKPHEERRNQRQYKKATPSFNTYFL